MSGLARVRLFNFRPVLFNIPASLLTITLDDPHGEETVMVVIPFSCCVDISYCSEHPGRSIQLL